MIGIGELKGKRLRSHIYELNTTTREWLTHCTSRFLGSTTFELELRSGQTPSFESSSVTPSPSTMSQFRAKRLDIGGYVNKWIIRDHTKRKVVAEYETERFIKSSPVKHSFVR
jgi:hypothetical protein